MFAAAAGVCPHASAAEAPWIVGSRWDMHNEKLHAVMMRSSVTKGGHPHVSQNAGWVLNPLVESGRTTGRITFSGSLSLRPLTLTVSVSNPPLTPLSPPRDPAVVPRIITAAGFGRRRSNE